MIQLLSPQMAYGSGATGGGGVLYLQAAPPQSQAQVLAAPPGMRLRFPGDDDP